MRTNLSASRLGTSVQLLTVVVVLFVLPLVRETLPGLMGIALFECMLVAAVMLDSFGKVIHWQRRIRFQICTS